MKRYFAVLAEEGPYIIAWMRNAVSHVSDGNPCQCREPKGQEPLSQSGCADSPCLAVGDSGPLKGLMRQRWCKS